MLIVLEDPLNEYFHRIEMIEKKLKRIENAVQKLASHVEDLRQTCIEDGQNIVSLLSLPGESGTKPLEYLAEHFPQEGKLVIVDRFFLDTEEKEKGIYNELLENLHKREIKALEIIVEEIVVEEIKEEIKNTTSETGKHLENKKAERLKKTRERQEKVKNYLDNECKKKGITLVVKQFKKDLRIHDRIWLLFHKDCAHPTSGFMVGTSFNGFSKHLFLIVELPSRDRDAFWAELKKAQLTDF